MKKIRNTEKFKGQIHLMIITLIFIGNIQPIYSQSDSIAEKSDLNREYFGVDLGIPFFIHDNVYNEKMNGFNFSLKVRLDSKNGYYSFIPFFNGTFVNQKLNNDSRNNISDDIIKFGIQIERSLIGRYHEEGNNYFNGFLRLNSCGVINELTAKTGARYELFEVINAIF